MPLAALSRGEEFEMESSNDCELSDAHTPNSGENATRPVRAAFELGAAGRVVAFWSAVVLLFAAIFVASTGLGSPSERALFGSLVLANVVALYVGHSYCTSRLA